MTSHSSLRFLADGRQRWMQSDEYRRWARETEERVRARFAPALAAAGGFERLRLRLRLARELRRELARLAPEDACWLASEPDPLADRVRAEGDSGAPPRAGRE